MSSFEVFIEELQRIYGGVGKICPVWPGIGLTQENTIISKMDSFSIDKLRYD